MFQNRKEALLLFLGDIVIFYFSLYLALAFRYFTFPAGEAFVQHAFPFSILSAVWIVTFFITGLYEKHTLLLKTRLPSTIFNAQISNTFLAVLFFYSIPYFKIAPKTILFIHLLISFALILAWRLYGVRLLRPATVQKGIIVGQGEEMRELIEEVNNNPRYGLEFISSIDVSEIESLNFKDEIISRVYSEGVQIIAIDLHNEKVEPILPNLYNLIFADVKFIDMYKIYEDIFDRVPLSLLKYNWFLENVSTSSHVAYDALKRIMDIIISIIVGSLNIVFCIVVGLAIKIEDGGKIFFTQEMIGKNNKVIKIWKFRSMSPARLASEVRSEARNEAQHITKVGKFIRSVRIDEWPQFWNVLKGDMSVIGPRAEIVSLVRNYENEIPYYNVRHLIKPGLSGWAQLYHRDPPKVVADAFKTRRKLSYDLYYIKNRSLMLDLKIALKTLKVILSRSGV
ncbi:MAG TPA: exopolysaccharide biosynthesis polyprenyl glycosylphosphotransferase [Candidatus Paceibacterota bacterium]